MTASKLTALTLANLFLFGCASTPTQRIIRDMAIAGAVGVLIGQQAKTHRDAHSLMYGGVLASGAAAAGLYIRNPDKEIEKYKAEAETLRKKLDEVFSPKLENQMPGTLSGKVPSKYKNMISPGEWRIYAIDQWIEEGENRLIHQDKIMELIPPSLRPIQNPMTKKGANHE